MNDAAAILAMRLGVVRELPDLPVITLMRSEAWVYGL
jgi:hypothetical protein